MLKISDLTPLLLEDSSKQIGNRKKTKKQDESTGYEQQSPTKENKKQENQNESFSARKWGTDYEPSTTRKKIKTRGVPRVNEQNNFEEKETKQDNQKYLALILANARLPLPLSIVWQIDSQYYEYYKGNPDMIKIWSNNWFRKANVKDDFAFIAMAIFEDLAKNLRLARRFHAVAQWGHAVGPKDDNGFVRTTKYIFKLKIVRELSCLIYLGSENKPIIYPPGYGNSRFFMPLKFIEKKDENEKEIQALYIKQG